VAAKEYMAEAGAHAGAVAQEKAVAAKEYVAETLPIVQEKAAAAGAIVQEKAAAAGAIVQEKAAAAGALASEKAVAAKDYVVEHTTTAVQQPGASKYCYVLRCWSYTPCAAHGTAPHFTAGLHAKTAVEIEEADKEAATRRASIQAHKVAVAAKMSDTAPAHERKNSLNAALSKEEVDATLAAAEERRKQFEQAKIDKAAMMADTEAARKRKEELGPQRINTNVPRGNELPRGLPSPFANLPSPSAIESH